MPPRALTPFWIAVFLVFCLNAPFGAASAQTAVDPATAGSFVAVDSEYKLPAKIISEVTSSLKTELWARVWYPTGAGLPQTLPLVVMLHGQHGTCGKLDPTGKWYIDDNADYTFKGTCPPGYRITPNHWGYDYIGRLLASNGYLVVSINVNRGINEAPDVASENDPGNIQRRARMILRHLQQLALWNTAGGTPTSVGFEFKGRIDFSRVSLFGHSRGAEAIVSANILYNDNGSPWPARLPSNLKFITLAAIAPSDFQTSGNPAGAYGLSYGVLLPMCDGDVITLAGMKYYDVATGVVIDTPRHFKASFATVGADHDGYNTEWHTQDSFSFVTDTAGTQDCPNQSHLFPVLGVSSSQQQLGQRFAMAMIRGATEGGKFAQLLNPAYQLPASIAAITEVDRGFFPGLAAGAGQRLMQFVGNGQCATELLVTAGSMAGSCGRAPEHDQLLTWIARIRWGQPVATTSTIYNFAYLVLNGQTAAFDLSKTQSIDFRIGPDCVVVRPSSGTFNDYGCSEMSKQGVGTAGSQGIAVGLIDRNGNLTNYAGMGDYVQQRQAVGINETPINSLTLINPLFHAMMSTARIPMSAFTVRANGTFDYTHVRKILLYVGGQNSSGGLFLGDILASDVAVTTTKSKSSEAALQALPVPQPLPKLVAGEEQIDADAPMVAAMPPPAAPADPESRIVSMRQLDLPAPSAGNPARIAPMVEFTLQTPRAMIEATSGFSMSIGGQASPVRYTGARVGPKFLTTLAIPAAIVAVAPPNATVAVFSGGSIWQFGTMPPAAKP